MMKAKALVLAGVMLLSMAGAAMAIEVGDSPVPFSVFNPSTSTNYDFPAAVKGKAALLLFFNTTCGACDSEISVTKTYLDKNPDAFQVILIAIDSQKEARAKVDAYVKEKGMSNSMVLMDPKFEIADKYGFPFTPAAVGFGKDGKALFVIKGFSRKDSGGYLGKLDTLAGK